MKETRASWINPHAYGAAYGSDDFQQMLRERTLSLLQTANLNTTFVIIPDHAEYHHAAAQEGFIPFLEMCTNAGIETHLWFYNKGRPGYTDFRNELERSAQVKWVLGWLDKYPDVVGVHLDGIRYSEEDVSPTTGPYAYYPMICDERTWAVTETVRLIREAIPNKLLLSVATKKISYRGERSGGPYTYTGEWSDYYWTEDAPFGCQCQQDTLDWLHRGLVDFVLPMNYTTNIDWWLYEVEQWILEGVDVDQLGTSVGWWASSGGPGTTKEEVTHKIKTTRQLDHKRIAIFELGSYHSYIAGDDDEQLSMHLGSDVFAEDATPYTGEIMSIITDLQTVENNLRTNATELINKAQELTIHADAIAQAIDDLQAVDNAIDELAELIEE